MSKPNVQNILAQLNPERSFMANKLISKDLMAFKQANLQEFFDGGLRHGELNEWGIPTGSGGREVLIQALAEATQKGLWSLWVRPKNAVQIYPPAWGARGVNLDRIRFAYTNQPISDLKPLFLDSFFRVIILDQPCHLSEEDSSFLARRAKDQNQVISIIRPHFLSEKHGNVWAKLRVNVWRTALSEQMCLQVIKGLSPRQISISRNSLC